jgi:hypothetical protein
MKLLIHREFLFGGFCGLIARVALCGGALFCGLTAINISNQISDSMYDVFVFYSLDVIIPL